MNVLGRNSSRAAASKHEAAFTLTDMLAITAVLLSLVALRLSTMAAAKDQTHIAQCAGNLRRFALAAHIFGNENNDRLPQVTAGFWAWDLDLGVTDALNKYGAPRNVMYCPANPSQNAEGLWNWVTNIPNAFRVIGYAPAFASSPSLTRTNLNELLTPQPISTAPVSGIVYPAPRAKDRPLIADATISLAGQANPTPSAEATYQWSHIPGGFTMPGWEGHRTAHMDRNLPAGGNIAMLDGHVQWRGLAAMLPRTAAGGSPTFWW